ncbi:NADH dehydrogenase [ubiquinone] 1 beta subcomplex subunit 7 [Pseudophryne corroboree]|uniref:NADH dehydrogenase [ubiquinone] 1 beta subcomplex subunit 7 n=1 Tax=Pseudophryne corroboree TaxID=495146 RepID=UPI0030818218
MWDGLVSYRVLQTGSNGGDPWWRWRKMGAHLARRYLGDASEPDPKTLRASPEGPQFQERVMVATQEQMNQALIPVRQRDYCAHHLIKFMKCKRDMWPNIFGCKHERHEWDYCEHEDYVLRMKQYERERRLMKRKLQQETEAA